MMIGNASPARIERGQPARTIVMLIHGTWAPQAPWTRPGSWFGRQLLETLKRYGVTAPELHPVDWSGANTHEARAQGSRELSARLRSLYMKSGDNCFLVGHSHGGNVALHAVVHDDYVSGSVRGVVTLATPFLLFRRENSIIARIAAGLDRAALAAVAWAVIPLFGLILMLPLTFVFHRLFEWKLRWLNGLRNLLVDGCAAIWAPRPCRAAIGTVAGAIDGLVAILIVLTLLLGGLFMATGEVDEARQAADRRLDSLAYLQPPERLGHIPILALSAPVDEALQVLNASWWAHRAGLWVLRLSVVASLMAGIGATALMLSALGMYEQSLVGTPGFTLAAAYLAFFAKVGLVPLAMGAGLLVGRIVRLAASVPALGHGAEIGSDNLYWTVHASRHPTGARLVTKRSYGLLGLLRRGGPLIHSRLYRSERAVADIAAFVAAHVRQLPAG
jgi:hypothetical protein